MSGTSLLAMDSSSRHTGFISSNLLQLKKSDGNLSEETRSSEKMCDSLHLKAVSNGQFTAENTRSRALEWPRESRWNEVYMYSTQY